MDRLRRIYQLHQILKTHRHPVALCAIQENLECSRASVNHIIREMWRFFDASIEYNRQGKLADIERDTHSNFAASYGILPALWWHVI
ncbi:MAG: hypothetical protein Q8S05_07480 [Sulfuricella sp.]|nr:hypothetical protein [Sulfuricella sp.]